MCREKKAKVLLFVMCIIIGALLVSQFRYSDGGKMYVSAGAISEYEALIASEQEATANVKLQIEEAEQILQSYEENAKKKDTEIMAEKLRSELSGYLTMSSAETVHGPGVVITVDDGDRELIEGEDINNLLVHDADILMIINELKKCKAEAISVNGHRITPYTSIVCSGYTVRMDGVTYARPFEIAAIGDAKRISTTLLSSEGYGTSLKQFGVRFSIEYAEDLTIAASDSGKTFKYAREEEAETE